MIVIASLVALLATPQGATDSLRSPLDPTGQATALRADRAPTIDGRDSDPVWQRAQPITEFIEFDPEEGKAPRYPTVAKIAYDNHNLFVFVRAFDPEPETIERLLVRRDDWPPSDHVVVIIDSYHDRRSGFEFGVNPAGAKMDASIANDGDEDPAWDGVWEVVAVVDSLGWCAEFRIPLSQLRFADAPSHTFGFAIVRDIARFKERLSWPQFYRNRAGIASQLGELSGIDGITSPRRLEIMPYLVTKNVTVSDGAVGYDHPQRLTGGADLKYGLASNLTLDATVNPDFGQIEADPAVLNLSAFETFYQERRPFFIEGGGLLRFSVNCNNINCSGEGLYYSRRIGRAPQLADAYGDARSPTATTIFGAAKLTGRLASGLSIGVLDAVTRGESGTLDRTIEPASNYALVRASQDLRGGETSVGVIGTAVHRHVDQWTRDDLRSSALVGGVNVRHRFLEQRYQISASITASRVSGNENAMAATQRSSVHYYQRPDAGLAYDTTRTALFGHAEQIRFAKVGGGMVNFETSYQRISAGYEINDLGYLQRADWQNQGTWVGLRWRQPTSWYRTISLNLNQWNDWTASGLSLGHYLNSNVHAELVNKWWVHFGATYSGYGATYCDRCARGGPATRRSQRISPWAGIEGDERRALAPAVWFNYSRTDEGQTVGLEVNPTLSLRVASRWSTSVGVRVYRNRDHTQWYGNYTDGAGTTHYTFAHLEQRTASLQLRLNFTATPNLTLQVYAEPFVTKGTYSDVREIADPRAPAYDDRYQTYGDTAVTNSPGAFNYKQFRSNVVLRWEYLPGSTLYLVWSQGRDESRAEYGTRSIIGEFKDLFGLHADNTFLVKVSHWFDW
ncbi:MAG: carbohydrate binding family 9 domain-containing protein [Gemmatimonadota bacterium]|nr:carbohydrate binding family 9 domain-containing protein [Gemmatimonadota bacterium]MDH3479271.1 carbohydrate binding family 9 domain-containing protein [Gemmatimonadota bacterium]MDH3570590.1 carbohydrate binding family 9 domain-containing protein [Gemmatimonadota bacterium]MDH5550574.1 carbohydrate binding family 9 domain-containing protein [Gemmatimonadota bacterium]